MFNICACHILMQEGTQIILEFKNSLLIKDITSRCYFILISVFPLSLIFKFKIVIKLNLST